MVLSYLFIEQIHVPSPPEIAVSVSPGTTSFLDELFEDDPEDDKLNRILQNQTVTLKLISHLFGEVRELKENCICNCGKRRSKFAFKADGSSSLGLGSGNSNSKFSFLEEKDFGAGSTTLESLGSGIRDSGSKVSLSSPGEKEFGAGSTTFESLGSGSKFSFSGGKDIGAGLTTLESSGSGIRDSSFNLSFLEEANYFGEGEGLTSLGDFEIGGEGDSETVGLLSENATSCYDEEGDSFLQEAIKIKSSSCSMGNFATKLLQVVFQHSELVGHNCSGTRNKGLLDQVKLGVIKKYVFKLYPCVQTQEDAQWRKCVFANEKKGWMQGKRLIILMVFK